jgi:hypothetical protein
MLIDMAGQAGKDKICDDFQQALRQEDEHLAGVREIVRQMAMNDSTMSGRGDMPIT